MATLLSKMDSTRRPPSSLLPEHGLCCIHGPVDKPALQPASLRMGLLLLATGLVALAAFISVARMVLD